MIRQLGAWAGKNFDRLRRAPAGARNLGPANWVGYQLKTRGLIASTRLNTNHARHPLAFRPGSSDPHVFHQIFVEREYSCLDHLPVGEVGLVVDCGANVGYSSAYFLSRFPNARVVAVEPDAENFRVLLQNLKPYSDRATAVNSGVWSHRCGLMMAEEQFGDGREWARHVRPARDGESPLLTALDIGSLLTESGFERISLLKVDVEGAEAIIFGHNYEGWVGRCDTIVVELHSAHCSEVFHKAIAGLPFCLSRCGELTVCITR